jgi:hypothetical protein
MPLGVRTQHREQGPSRFRLAFAQQFEHRLARPRISDKVRGHNV